jgi:hypothetical protein
MACCGISAMCSMSLGMVTCQEQKVHVFPVLDPSQVWPMVAAMGDLGADWKDDDFHETIIESWVLLENSLDFRLWN